MTVKSLYPFVNPSSLLESPQSNLDSNSQLLHRYGVYLAYALAYHAATRYERFSVKAACRRSTAGHKTFYRCLFSLSACSLVWVFDLRPPFLGPAAYKTSGSQLWKEFIETLDSRLI